MKLSLFVTAVLCFAIQAADASTHLRVHILTELASAGQQCEWENKAVKCEATAFCQKSDRHTGFCMKKSPGLNDQCGGKGVNGPWSVTCNSSDLKCVLQSSTKSTCQKKTE
ncbi:hypothetical protein F441_10466 [Phytophthora nicotianae CJ01A1]|uniref:Small cysteine rich protein SCR108 n=5 Tax=Phytophthora nicotianae TaxID=4792 RepID=V9F1Z9_PHYNI|nr:hypothetical protein F443_10529 [Phytophthora nicotianae P1569]ETK84782.1 hypothetical protein L915_10286 [Phytophthora nicotianae]ETO73438.1 hypothetical protein F444_10619 [Phytophthora nicotianae P1976]ETP14619.1 hypothetical protein F441_10466 [Phytophthora nicotianae CJ01A1]ETP42692.1 hypothetical protein F442_10426 [Phytophthora nicotianae P10297]KUF80472.1 Small cysteine rich protein [Phytophthora nicotianae]